MRKPYYFTKEQSDLVIGACEDIANTFEASEPDFANDMLQIAATVKLENGVALSRSEATMIIEQIETWGWVEPEDKTDLEVINILKY